jgi:hypothetical protein
VIEFVERGDLLAAIGVVDNAFLLTAGKLSQGSIARVRDA